MQKTRTGHVKIEEYKAQKITVVEPFASEIILALTDDDCIKIIYGIDPEEKIYYFIKNENLCCIDEHGNFGYEQDAKRFRSIDEAKGFFWSKYGEPTRNFGEI